jgi:hypothetical protein
MARVASRIARDCRKRVRMRLREFLRSSSASGTRVACFISQRVRTHRSHAELRLHSQQHLGVRRGHALRTNTRGQSAMEGIMT